MSAALLDAPKDIFANAYAAHVQHLRRIARRVLRDRSDAEDLVHDVFVEAWTRRSDYDEQRGTLQSWLSVRLRARAIDRLRGRAREQRIMQAAFAVPFASVQPYELGADRSRLFTALEALSDKHLEVLVQVYADDLGLSAIADLAAVPLGTVKSRLRNALEKLRIHHQGM